MNVSRDALLPELIRLGLTSQAAEAYQILLQRRSMTIRALAKQMKVLPNALYRVLQALEDKGLVLRRESHPAIFWAVPPAIGLEKLVLIEKDRLEQIKQSAIKELTPRTSAQPETTVDLLPGKEQFYKSYIDMARKAQDEILIISIGEPVGDEILLVNRDAVERGAKIKIIYHRYDETNQDMIERYIKMGWEVRHYPDWGFHLVVVDGKKALLGVNNPKATDERVGMLMESEGMAKAMRDYFYSVWEKALVIAKS